jgi:hypothetical protein
VSVAQGFLTRDGRRTRPIAAHGGNAAGTQLRRGILLAPWISAPDFFLAYDPHTRPIIRERTMGARRGRRRLPTTAAYDGVFWSRRWATEVGETEQQGASMIFIELRSEVRSRSTTTATRALRSCRRRTRRGGLRGGVPDRRDPHAGPRTT